MMEMSTTGFKDNVSKALADSKLQFAMTETGPRFIAKRTKAREALPEFDQLRVERQDGALVLHASLKLELGAVVEDALLKGVSLYFVTEAELTQERWYFYDKRVALAERHVRVMYQPLTRRWRVSVLPHAFSGTGLGVSLGQSYASAEEAMQTVRRLTQWRIANAADLNAEAKQTLFVRFKLDLLQLPRPLQMGALTQSEWNISYSKSQRLTVESER